MAEQMSLDNILDEKPVKRDESGKFASTEPVKTETQTETPVQPVKEQVKQEVKTEIKEPPKEPVKEQPKQDFSDKERAFQAAALDERRKRQELEAKYQALEKQLNEKKDPPKPFWDSPDEALAKQKTDIQAELASIRTQAQSEMVNTKLGVFEALARSRHPDFDKNIEEFGKIMQTSPHLHKEWIQSADPAEYANSMGKNAIRLREAGSIDKLMEQKEKEIRLKIETELKEKEEKLRKERESIPGSLSDTRGMTQTKTEWSGPTSLDDVLKG